MQLQLIIVAVLTAPAVMAQPVDTAPAAKGKGPSQAALRLKVVDRMFAAREQLRGGKVEVVRVRQDAHAGHPVEFDETASFLGQKHRVDRHGDSETQHAFEILGYPAPELFRTDIWDGEHFLATRADLNRTYCTLGYAEGGKGRWGYNARWIGFPFVRAPYTDARAQFCASEVLDVSQAGDVYTLLLRLDRRDGSRVLATSSTIRMTVDASKDFALTSYEVNEDNGGFHWVLKGKTTYAQFGDVWFPQFYRHEQWRDGNLDFAWEYSIVDAEFGRNVVAPEQFTWKGTGIRPRDPIYSSAPGIPISMWDGEKVVP